MKIKFAIAAGLIAYHLFTPANLNDNQIESVKEQQTSAQKKSSKFKPPLVTFHKRTLTAEETALVHTIFGKKLALPDIQIVFHNKAQKTYISEVQESDPPVIMVYGAQYFSRDYSKETDSELYGTFIYEMMRISQLPDYPFFNKQGALDYPETLKGTSQFTDYTTQGQSKLLEDYARRFLHPDRGTLYLKNNTGWDNCDNDDLLARVIEHEFPEAKKTRTTLEKKYRRALTQNERTLLKNIFGGQINTSIINLYLNKRDCAKKVGSARGRQNAYFWGEKNHSDDYSTEENSGKFGTFIHESTHVWQNQTKGRYTNRSFENKPDKYAYPIDIEKYKFTNYATEQQAAIIEDYARYFLHAGKETWKLSETADNLQQLQTLVEKQFPGMAKLRADYESHGTLFPSQSKNTHTSKTQDMKHLNF